jgi:N,N-dimethylformamidase
VPYDHDSVVAGRMRRRLRPSSRPLLWSGVWDHNAERGDHVRWLYNGKIEHPVVTRGARPARELLAAASDDAEFVADWDAGLDLSPAGVDDVIRDHGPHGLHAHGRNKPVRAMTGRDWDGRTDCFPTSPPTSSGRSTSRTAR